MSKRIVVDPVTPKFGFSAPIQVAVFTLNPNFQPWEAAEQ